jgi:hypothetical protein
MNRSFSEGVRDAFDRVSDMDRAMSIDTMAHHAKQHTFGAPLFPHMNPASCLPQ